MNIHLDSIRPLRTWRGKVLKEWVDYNGHLRDAYYLLVFSLASDSLMSHIGLDEIGRKSTGHSLFTLECHLNFLHEVKAGAAVEVYTQILAFDKKRLHIFQSLHLQEMESAVAVNEQMLLNVDMAGPKSTAFAESVLHNLERLANLHAGLARPEMIGRVMGLPSAKRKTQ
jgi:acyl-CoA thioester hydrolase